MRQQERPKPPADLEGEALLEWDRVCDDLDALGLLDAADRAILTLYVRTWAVWSEAAKAVATVGAVVLWPNKMPGPSSEYKVMMETGKQVDQLLNQLGLTPAARGLKAADDAPEPLQF